MTTRDLLVESGPLGLRAALLVDRKLMALEIDHAARPTSVGRITRVKVGRTAQGLGTILKSPDGVEFLLDRGRGGLPEAGEVLTVQVIRDARGGKLGVASRTVALSGRGVIHLPFEPGIRASRRLVVDADTRASLDRRFADRPGGWILRRTAALIDPDELGAEIESLARCGAQLHDDPARPPPDAFHRLATDEAVPTPDRILVSGREAERSAKLWCAAFAPSLLPRIDRYRETTPLFEFHDLEGAIEALSHSRVALPRGGSLVIEPTEALIAIDVNAGAETNLLTANLAAATEIARQLRLRHLGGIVVIDFISLGKQRDRAKIVATLESALADDSAQTHVLPMSAFGLVEMTRERRGPDLAIGVDS